MKYLFLCIAAGALALAGGAAAAPTETPTPATPGTTVVTAPGKKKTQRVCRERQRSGSHLTNIVCKTPEQWAELQDQLDTEAELGIPGNKTATGRAVDRGMPRQAGPPR
jgi:hypothetical protein